MQVRNQTLRADTVSADSMMFSWDCQESCRNVKGKCTMTSVLPPVLPLDCRFILRIADSFVGLPIHVIF